MEFHSRKWLETLEATIPGAGEPSVDLSDMKVSHLVYLAGHVSCWSMEGSMNDRGASKPRQITDYIGQKS